MLGPGERLERPWGACRIFMSANPRKPGRPRGTLSGFLCAQSREQGRRAGRGTTSRSLHDGRRAQSLPGRVARAVGRRRGRTAHRRHRPRAHRRRGRSSVGGLRVQRPARRTSTEPLGGRPRAADQPDERHAADRRRCQHRDRAGRHRDRGRPPGHVQHRDGHRPGDEGPCQRRRARPAAGPAGSGPSGRPRRPGRRDGARARRCRAPGSGRHGPGRRQDRDVGHARGPGGCAHRGERARAKGRHDRCRDRHRPR